MILIALSRQIFPSFTSSANTSSLKSSILTGSPVSRTSLADLDLNPNKINIIWSLHIPD